MNPQDQRYIAAKIRLVAMDVDGTLTDGSVWVAESGEISKKFFIKDIMGLKRLSEKGIILAIISGEYSKTVDIFAKRLKITDVFQDIRNKDEYIEKLSAKYNISVENMSFIGDDINDISALKIVGLPVCVNNANQRLKQMDNILITNACGGAGAVRELADLILDGDLIQL